MDRKDLVALERIGFIVVILMPIQITVGEFVWNLIDIDGSLIAEPIALDAAPKNVLGLICINPWNPFQNLLNDYVLLPSSISRPYSRGLIRRSDSR
jgi:hypothetical protein